MREEDRGKGIERNAHFVDTHVHLDDPDFDADRAEVIARALSAGVIAIVSVGAGLESSRAAVSLAEKHPALYAAVGVHPHEARTLNPEGRAELRALARHPQVVAIGETGLDYYRNLSPQKIQRQVFETHLTLADEWGKPVIVHDREAHDEVMTILRRWAGGRTGGKAGVLHCFSGDLDMAQEAIELGFYISIAGPVTFLNARRLAEKVRRLPLERLLIETDGPYLAPHPYRGKRNEPAHVRLVAEAIARLKDISLQEVAAITTDNARALFGLNLRSAGPDEYEGGK